MVLDDDACFGNAGGAAGFEDVDRFVLVGFWHPATHGATAEPFVFEQREFLQICEAIDIFEGIEVERFFLFQPEFAACVVTEVPVDHFTSVLVKEFLLTADFVLEIGHGEIPFRGMDGKFCGKELQDGRFANPNCNFERSGEQEFGPVCGPASGERGVFEGPEGEHHGLFGLGGIVAGSGVEAASVEEKDIAWFEEYGDGGLQERLVFGDIGAEKEGFVESIAGGCSGVGAWEHLQAAVVEIFGPEGDPDVDEVAVGERPVAGILVPASVAAEAGLFGHDAVMVGERHDDVGAEDLLEAAEDGGEPHELHEYGVSADGLAESADGFSAFSVEGCGGAGVVEVGFVFDIAEVSGEVAIGHGSQGMEERFVDESGDDEETLLLEKLQFMGGKFDGCSRWETCGCCHPGGPEEPAA